MHSHTTPPATGIEAMVCEDIARRQQMGRAKYGTTLAENNAPLVERLQHAYEETLDHANYLKWAMEKLRAEQDLAPEPLADIERTLADLDAATARKWQGHPEAQAHSLFARASAAIRALQPAALKAASADKRISQLADELRQATADLCHLREGRRIDALIVGRAIVTLQGKDAVGYRPSGGTRPDMERSISELMDMMRRWGHAHHE